MPRKQLAVGLFFLSPWLLGFFVLTIYPFVASLYWSFCRYDLLTEPQWVGLDNYQRLATELAEGGAFAQALGNTAYFAVGSVTLLSLIHI